LNKNLAIANRSRVSYADNTLKASRHKYYTVTLKSRLKDTHCKVTGNGTIGYGRSYTTTYYYSLVI